MILPLLAGILTGILLHILYDKYKDRRWDEISWRRLEQILNETHPGYLEIFEDGGDWFVKMESFDGHYFTDRIDPNSGRIRINLYPPPLLPEKPKESQ